MRYDAGPGVRSENDVRALVDFYRARRGPAVAFRFRDPIDSLAEDQALGVGDGIRTDFALTKAYGSGAGAPQRRITRPVPGSVAVRAGGALVSGWLLTAGGVVSFAAPPASGVPLRVSYAFDVPVRFAEDRLEVSRATYLAGEIANVPLIEVREG